jgi:hypothetical protein
MQLTGACFQHDVGAINSCVLITTDDGEESVVCPIQPAILGCAVSDSCDWLIKLLSGVFHILPEAEV